MCSQGCSGVLKPLILRPCIDSYYDEYLFIQKKCAFEYAHPFTYIAFQPTGQPKTYLIKPSHSSHKRERQKQKRRRPPAIVTTHSVVRLDSPEPGTPVPSAASMCRRRWRTWRTARPVRPAGTSSPPPPSASSGASGCPRSAPGFVSTSAATAGRL